MDGPFHRILVATDFSANSEQAVRAAAELSAVYSAPLMLVHVHDPLAYPLPDGYIAFTAVQLSETWEELERRLALATADARAAGAVHAEARLLQGPTAAEIVRIAKAGGYDLVVMGTHGRKGLARILLGSVAARVVQTAECAVLTVRRSAQFTREATPAAPTPSP